MLARTRKWLYRNRYNFAIGAGVVGAGYVATQYVLSKVTEARQRMSDDRISRENLRRRFEQNQQDCTYTVLAILPTATENILEALPVESLVAELQKQKAERLSRSVGPSEVASSADLPQSASPSTADGLSAIADDDGKSLTSFQSESYIHASQVTGSSNGEGESVPLPAAKPKSKKALWDEMKISSISRSFTLLYTLSLLTLLTRIQLNLLGRRNYLASVVSLASPPLHGQESRINLENHDDDNLEHAFGNDFETNRKYLSFSWWLLHCGCKEIMENVLGVVKEVFGPLNPREEITLDRLGQLTLEVRKRIEGATKEDRTAKSWLSYLLPPSDQEEHLLQESGMISPPSDSPQSHSGPIIPQSLRRLLDETSDLISSPHFSHVLTLCLDASFSLLIDNKLATLAFKIPPTSSSAQRVQEIVGADEVRAKIANCLPVFCRQAHAIGTGGGVGFESAQGNEYLAAIETVRELEAFAAVVYSSNFEFEAPEVEGSTVFVSRPGTAGGVAAQEGPTESQTEVGTTSAFEAAWGKATGSSEK